MTRHPASVEPSRGSDAGRDEHRRLEVAFHAAALDVDDLDAARRNLLARLSLHSDDFAATTALQALNTFSAGLRTDHPSDAPTHVRDAGLSSLQRMRRRREVTTA
jgi:hypothetical protein